MFSFFEYVRLSCLLLALGLSGCSGLGGSDSAKVEASSPLAEAAGAAAGVFVSANPDYRMPSRVSLCGEAFDLNNQSVYERLEFEFIRVVNHPAQVALWQRRAAIYFPAIEADLRAANLPDDLKYLAVAESDLRPWIVSPAGALGLWQFMPQTARYFGLNVDKKKDVRHLPEPLTGAATSYFQTLYRKFGSWSLAMAAYNAGDGRVAKAVEAQGVKNYFELDLPRETERYVYRIAAIKVVMENASAYGFNQLVPSEHYHPVKYADRTVQLPAQSAGQWPQLAKQLGCGYKELRMGNPHILEQRLSGTYEIRVPVSK